MWQVAIEICSRVGGDPGNPGLFGPSHTPAARKPECLILLETEGWNVLDEKSHNVFEQILERMRAKGITILRRGDDPLIEAFEVSLADCKAYSSDIRGFEGAWVLRNIEQQLPGKLSQRIRDVYEGDRKLTLRA